MWSRLEKVILSDLEIREKVHLGSVGARQEILVLQRVFGFWALRLCFGFDRVKFQMRQN